jgi:hypothetical protein
MAFHVKGAAWASKVVGGLSNERCRLITKIYNYTFDVLSR